MFTLSRPHAPMTTCRALAVCLLLVLLGALPSEAQPTDAIHISGYVIYPSIVDADAISAPVARRLALPRGRDWLVVDLSVMRGPNAAHGVPVASRVEGTATTLLGKRLPLQFRIVTDDGPPHSLAVIQVSRPDTLTFTLRVAPEDAAPFRIDFSRDIR